MNLSTFYQIIINFVLNSYKIHIKFSFLFHIKFGCYLIGSVTFLQFSPFKPKKCWKQDEKWHYINKKRTTCTRQACFLRYSCTSGLLKNQSYSNLNSCTSNVEVPNPLLKKQFWKINITISFYGIIWFDLNSPCKTLFHPTHTY